MVNSGYLKMRNEHSSRIIGLLENDGVQGHKVKNIGDICWQDSTNPNALIAVRYEDGEIGLVGYYGGGIEAITEGDGLDLIRKMKALPKLDFEEGSIKVFYSDEGYIIFVSKFSDCKWRVARICQQ